MILAAVGENPLQLHRKAVCPEARFAGVEVLLDHLPRVVIQFAVYVPVQLYLGLGAVATRIKESASVFAGHDPAPDPHIAPAPDATIPEPPVPAGTAPDVADPGATVPTFAGPSCSTRPREMT